VHAEWLAQRARAQSGLAALATRMSPHHRYLLAAEQALFTSPRLRAVICNSQMVRGEIAQRFGTPLDKLVLIRNSVDAAAFHPDKRGETGLAVRQQLEIPEHATVALHVGSGFERKGVATFLRVLARASGAPWGIVVGKDKRSARYAALAAKLGLKARVRFVGSVSDVRPYYAAADSFLLATLYDPFPNAALEAMASGLPVVTTSRCGTAELLAEGETGFVRDALDVTGLADALGRLDPASAARMGANARDAVAGLTPGLMAGEYLALYRRLLHR
jgi:UDP-glucose:(heptosyl)LPS alpha-1,3-glucosyltransferase